MAGRRSRGPESEDEGESSRAGTPLSTAPDDRKRARRGFAEEQPLSSNGSPSTNGATGKLPTREEKKPSLINGILSEKPRHQPGAIIRVKLTNFVTYTSAEFFPGPGLNMVVGPNGTGKSTLVCAICLGLGWGTSVLGRAKDPSEFVKHRCREATIEIELQKATEGDHKSRHNPIFTRTIKRDGNKSTYTLSGRPTTQKLVQELARKFNIQIDNLCQFLPQDRVVEFAAMTPIELLKSTQQAAAPPEMLEWHENLKKLREHQRELFTEYKHDKEQILNLKGRQEANRVDVEKMREKMETQKRVGWLQKCRPAPKYAEAKEKAKEARQKQKRLTTELKKLKEELAPTLRKVNAKEEYVLQVMALKKQREKDVKEAEKECAAIDGEDAKLRDKMADCDRRIDAEDKSRPSKRRELTELQRKTTTLKAEMAKPRPELDTRAISAQIHEKIERKRQLEAEHEERKATLINLKTQGGERNKRIGELKQRLQDFDTKAGQQHNKLEKTYGETYRAWDWIQKNKDRFENEVFGPPIVSCSLKDPSMADMVESFLRDTDFKFITFQSLRDFDVMRRQMKSMGLHDVSLRTCSITSLDQFRPPLATQRLRELGLDSWAIDHLEGPANVLAMFCQENRLHLAGVAHREVNNDQYNEIVKSGMTSWIAGRTAYSITRRKEYGSAGESTKTSQIRSARIWTDSPVDASGDKARLERELGELDTENREIYEQFTAVKADEKEAGDEIKTLESEIQALREQKEAHQKALMAFDALPAKLEDSQRRVALTQEGLASIQDRIDKCRKERDRYLVQRAEVAIRFAAAIGVLKEKLESSLEAEMWFIEAQSDYETLKSRNEGINDLLTRKKEEEIEAAEAAGVESQKAKDLVTVIMQLKNEAVKLEQEQGDSGLMELFRMIGDQKTTSEQLEAMIESDLAKLELIQGLDGIVVQDFERRAQRIEELEEKQTAAEEKLEAVRDAITEIREKWEPKLDELVGRISEKFGESFARIGCAGQVAVYKASAGENDDDDNANMRDARAAMDEQTAGNGLDFANWAVHVSVKFRENEPLSLLDAHRQSGGERAVSTIFYLMALQSLSRAPFRVVDEINQGMDPRNERMVHGRMVDICSPRPRGSDAATNSRDASETEDAGDDDDEEPGSQYFLVTPKLLSGLKYRRGMTVLCIVSGEHVPAVPGEEQRDGVEVKVRSKEGEVERRRLWKVDFRRFVERARALGLGNGGGEGGAAGGKRVDSGVGIGIRMQGSFASASGSGSGSERSPTVSVGA